MAARVDRPAWCDRGVRRAALGTGLWLTLVAAGCAPRAGGNLLLLGGGTAPAEFFPRLVALAGGSRARLVVLPLASAESRPVGEQNRRDLLAAGAAEVTVLHIDQKSDAARADYLDAVAHASGIFFSGGDQRRITERLLDTPLYDAIVALRQRGGVVGGTSAGAACQSAIMLVGDGDEHIIRAHNIVTARGLGLFAGVIVDSHFVARGRNNRLISAVLEHPERVGVGIDESTAAWVKPDGSLEVLGLGTIVLYDARHATVREEGGRLAAVGVRAAVLIPGQRYDLAGARLLP